MSHAGTDRGKPAFIYARVSTAEQRDEGYSLDAQLQLLRDYASKCGFLVKGEFVEAESGSKAGRSAFGEMFEALRGEVGAVVICEKTDRLYRNFADMVRLDELGTELHFVKEGVVIGPESRANDRFMHSIKVCLAKHFSDNLREEVRKGMREKARQGIFPSVAPAGYRNVTEGSRKVIEPDPVMAPLVRHLFEAYARQEVSLDSAARLAKEIGLRTRKGKCFARSSIARMLENPLYMGVVRWDGETSAGVHEPIVPPEVFATVQEVMHGRATNRGFGGRTFPYRGLMTCAYCGCSITAELKKGRYVYYRCTGMRDRKCPGMKTTGEQKLTDQFARLLNGLVLSEERLEDLKEALRASFQEETTRQNATRRAIAGRIAEIRVKLERMYLDRIDDRVSEDVYDSLRAKLSKELAELEVRQGAFSKAEGSYQDLGLALLELAQTAPIRFICAEADTKRNILLELVERAELKDGIVQVWLNEPFDTLLRQNVFRTENPLKEGESENWYSRRDSNPRSSP